WNAPLKNLYSWQDLNFQSYSDTKKFISSLDADYILCGNIPFDQLLVIRNHFPKLIDAEKGFNREFFIYAKSSTPEPAINDFVFTDSLNFRHPKKFWNENPPSVRSDSAGRFFFHVDSTQQYSAGFAAPLDSITKDRDDILEVSVVAKNVPHDCPAS